MEATPIRYVRTRDGMDVAYYIRGHGRPIVFMPFHWNHLERRWTGPYWVRGLAERNQVIAYDSRGQGLSTTNLTSDPSLEDYRLDLETVIGAAGVEKVVLVGYGGFGHVAFRYAVDHPERIEALVLICTCESFSTWPLVEMLPLAEQNWDLVLDFVAAHVQPAFKDIFISFVRASTTREDFVHLVRGFSRSNIADILDSVRVPVLILHSLDQHWLSMEEGSTFAAKVPGSRLVFMDGGVEPNDQEAVRAIQQFLDELPGSPQAGLDSPQAPAAPGLSPRQREVLHLLSLGKTTREIAADLVLSDRTVERHISDVYAKIGVTNRAAAIAYTFRALQ